MDAEGRPADYCTKASAWRFDAATKKWQLVTLWIGITDNVTTEILAGAKPGDPFVKRFIDSSSTGFKLKEAIKLASPDNRTI